jgi:hypothetical protein
MGSQRLLSVAARRTQILECISLIEKSRSKHRGPGVGRLLRSLREKAEWLQKIELEQQQADPSESRNVSKVPRASDAA